MTIYHTSEQVKGRYITEMGEPLGKLYYGLYNEVVWLHNIWHEYVELFGAKESRVDLAQSSRSELLQTDSRFDVGGNTAADYQAYRFPKRGEQGRLTLCALPKLVDPGCATGGRESAAQCP